MEPRRLGGATATSLGPIPFGSDTAAYFRDQVQAPFFAYFLKDKGTRALPEALMFQTGANRWRRWSQWPPRGDQDRRPLLRRQRVLGR